MKQDLVTSKYLRGIKRINVPKKRKEMESFRANKL